MTEQQIGAEVINYEQTDVDAELRERSGGRGPDVCIEAVGLEAHTCIPMLLDRVASGELRTAHLATHPMPLDEGPPGYDLFKNTKDGCVRSVFQPAG
jgi:threonine dehydrogenase-like Zn-dependent dehydrogenase